MTTEEMVAVGWLGFILLCYESFPQRYVLGMELDRV